MAIIRAQTYKTEPLLEIICTVIEWAMKILNDENAVWDKCLLVEEILKGGCSYKCYIN